MGLYNLVSMTSATAGTGALTLGSAVSGFLSFADAGVPDGTEVSYAIVDGANTEVGRGTYTSAGTTLSRDTVLASTNSGNKINCSGSEQVSIAILAENVASNILISGVPHKQLLITNWKPKVTSGCGDSEQLEMTTNKNCYDAPPFDKDSVEYAYANVEMPDDYTDGVIYARFNWTHGATTTNFKVSWGLRGVAVSNDDALDVAQGTAQYANDEGGTAYDRYRSEMTDAITIAGSPAAGDFVNFEALRNATDATNDTLDVDAYLLGVMIWYPVG